MAIFWWASLTVAFGCDDSDSNPQMTTPDSEIVDAANSTESRAAPTLIEGKADDMMTPIDEPVDAMTPMDASLDMGVTTPEALQCNGSAALCSRHYNDVVYLTTHNAMSTAHDNWLAPNQTHGLTRQLDDGVRGLMWDVYMEDGQVLLCHSICQAGQRPLVEALEELRTFLDSHPENVITIIFESYVEHSILVRAFKDAKLDQEIWSFDGEWPTLEQMITEKRRLVVLSDEKPTEPSLGIHFVWDVAWETHFSAQTKEDFSCRKNRGDASHDLFIFNHFLTRPIALLELAQEVNIDPFLSERVQKCIDESGQTPNFLTVDFYEVGAARDLVNRLNME